MTTITYKDGILAADTQLTINNVKIYGSKIFQLRPGFIIACAGDISEEYKAHKFFAQTDWRDKELPDFPPKDQWDDETKPSFSCIFIEDGQPFFCANTYVPLRLEHPYYAIGSGGDIAMGGMHLGLTAAQAILLASEIDINTNDVVDFYDLKNGQIKRYEPKR